uniref:Uncharacterized protein n=1 Tax=Cacopsylla melanoneura TaxID=428564 RepID=A0A8D9EU79_9HEMI
MPRMSSNLQAFPTVGVMQAVASLTTLHQAHLTTQWVHLTTQWVHLTTQWVHRTTQWVHLLVHLLSTVPSLLHRTVGYHLSIVVPLPLKIHHCLQLQTARSLTSIHQEKHIEEHHLRIKTGVVHFNTVCPLLSIALSIYRLCHKLKIL